MSLPRGQFVRPLLGSLRYEVAKRRRRSLLAAGLSVIKCARPPRAKSRLQFFFLLHGREFTPCRFPLPVSQWQKHRWQINTRANREVGTRRERHSCVLQETQKYIFTRLRAHICFYTFSSENRMIHLCK